MISEVNIARAGSLRSDISSGSEIRRYIVCEHVSFESELEKHASMYRPTTLVYARLTRARGHSMYTLSECRSTVTDPEHDCRIRIMTRMAFIDKRDRRQRLLHSVEALKGLDFHDGGYTMGVYDRQTPCTSHRAIDQKTKGLAMTM